MSIYGLLSIEVLSILGKYLLNHIQIFNLCIVCIRSSLMIIMMANGDILYAIPRFVVSYSK